MVEGLHSHSGPELRVRRGSPPVGAKPASCEGDREQWPHRAPRPGSPPAAGVASAAEKDAAMRHSGRLRVERTPEISRRQWATPIARRAADGWSPPDRTSAPTEVRISRHMQTGCEKVAALPDPVGELLDDGVPVPNGPRDPKRVRVPWGVVATIYEKRPNRDETTPPACAEVRGGPMPRWLVRGVGLGARRSRGSQRFAAREIAEAGSCRGRRLLVEDTAHARPRRAHAGSPSSAIAMIPRGGHELIRRCAEHATVPSSIDATGNAHVYVRRRRRHRRALEIVVNPDDGTSV